MIPYSILLTSVLSFSKLISITVHLLNVFWHIVYYAKHLSFAPFTFILFITGNWHSLFIHFYTCTWVALLYLVFVILLFFFSRYALLYGFGKMYLLLFRILVVKTITNYHLVLFTYCFFFFVTHSLPTLCTLGSI